MTAVLERAGTIRRDPGESVVYGRAKRSDGLGKYLAEAVNRVDD